MSRNKAFPLFAALAAASCLDQAVAQTPLHKQAGAPPGVVGNTSDPSIPFQAGRPPLKSRPVGDAAVIRTVVDAIGLIRLVPPRETTDAVNRLEWRGSGVLYRDGAAVPIPAYSYGLSLHLSAAREDIQLGSGPGASRIIDVVAGEKAWDESSPGVATRLRPDQAKVRRLALSRTPFGLARALAKAAPGSVKVNDRGPASPVTLDLDIEGVPTHVMLDRQYRPIEVTQVFDGHVYSDHYGAYKDLTEYGLMFPTRVEDQVDGRLKLKLNVKDARVASYLVFPAPAEVDVTNSAARG